MTFEALQQLNERPVTIPAGQPWYDYHIEEISRDSQGRRRRQGWVLLSDFRGGLDQQAGPFGRYFDRISEGTLDVRHEAEGVLPLLFTEQTTPDPAGTVAGMHWAHIFGTLMIAAGSTNDQCLFKETSSSNPAIVAVTGASTGGRPGAAFTCFHPATFDGTKVLGVLGLAGTTPIAITDDDGTLHATAPHADLKNLWGLIQTFTNDNMILFYAGDPGDCYIRTLRSTNDWDVEPNIAGGTVKPTSMRAGGSAIGLKKLGGGLGDARAFWREPLVDTSSQHVSAGALVPHNVVHTNAEGLDKQPFLFTPELTQLYWSEFYRDGIVASDLKSIIFKNGTDTVDLRIFADPPANSGVEYFAWKVWIIGGVLTVLVERRGASESHWQLWEYDFEAASWLPVSRWVARTSTSGPTGLMTAGSGPWSLETRYKHHYVDGSWWRQRWVQPGQSTFALRHTPGATAGTGEEYESSAYLVTPRWSLEGAHGWSIYVTGFDFLGDLEAGGTASTPAYVEVSAGGVKRRFTANAVLAERVRSEVAEVMPEGASDGLQVRFDVAQQSGGTDATRLTPNVLPVRVHFLAVDNAPERAYPDLQTLPRR